MIPQSFIQDLLGRVDIVDVVESAVPLKRSGANLVACCPFHSEKSPSFTVSPTKQFYHCFGCGAHGTAISFMMEFYGLGFVDAVKDLAARVGMTVPEPGTGARRAQQRQAEANLPDVLARAARYYKEQLKRSERAIQYLKGRGLTGEVAARFGLGYAPEGWQNLAQVFDDYAAKALVEAGLVIVSEEGRRYDRFRDRIMFPIVNTRGDIVGFGGRVLGQGEPKYLNSPETPVFEKGRELYGLFQARQAVRAAGRVLVVEGYMDVVALSQHGVGYAVATLGTATTPHHVQKLLRQADRVTFCFDGDSAGRRAAWRALETSLQALVDGKHVSFLFLPEGEDPDSFVRRAGKEAFEALVDEAEPLSTYMLRELQSGLDMSTAEGRAAFLKHAEALLKQISAPNLALAMRQAVAAAAGVRPDELAGGAPPSRRGAGAAAAPARALRPGPTTRLEDTALRALAARPDLYAVALEAARLGRAVGRWEAVRDLAEAIGAGAVGQGTAAVLQHLIDAGHADVAAELERSLMELKDDHDHGAELSDILAKLRQAETRRRVATAVASARSVAELPDEARDLVRHGGRTPGTSGN